MFGNKYIFLIIFVYLFYLGLKGKSRPTHIEDLITNFGYPVETHFNINTSDGYLLTMHRIPYGKNKIPAEKHEPVLLVHGFMGSAEHFLFAGPDRSLAFLLADQGYDVWLANSRCTSYSRSHVKYDPDVDIDYWDFGFDELGKYDIPALIDYVLKINGAKSLQYVGHSQGAVTFFVMCSHFPEYSEKVKLMIALAPGVYFKNLTYPHTTINNFVLNAYSITEYFGIREITIATDLFKYVTPKLCAFPIISDICIQILFYLAGTNHNQFDKETLSKLTSTTFESVSIKQYVHLLQQFGNDCLQNFDYGTKLNLEKYGTKLPPKYNVNNTNSPIALYYSSNDHFTSKDNVQRLAKDLHNVADLFEVPHELFTHLDFIYAKDIVTLLYGRVLDLMDIFRKQ